jgi:hypothetical protein
VNCHSRDHSALLSIAPQLLVVQFQFHNVSNVGSGEVPARSLGPPGSSLQIYRKLNDDPSMTTLKRICCHGVRAGSAKVLITIE